MAQEYLSLEEKVAALKTFGDESMIEVFKDWSPARYNYRKKSAPLDQRISVAVTKEDKDRLLKDIKDLKDSGERISMSQYIRNRATGNIDLNEWRESAEEALRDISHLKSNYKDLKKEKSSLQYTIENEDDDEAIIVARIRIGEIDEYLNLLKSNKIKRPIRLAGRTTFAEREIIVWRAQRLALNISDYLRFAVFGYLPHSEADAHLPLESRQRFYISVLEVAENGFGSPPSSATCSNCVTYLEELAKLRDEVRSLRQFA